MQQSRAGGPDISHVCRDCGRVHEVAVTCVTCDNLASLRYWWYTLGRDQGLKEAELKHREQLETLHAEIAFLRGTYSQRAATNAAGPSFKQLQAARYGR